VGARPDERIMAYVSRRFGWGWRAWEERGLGLAAGPSLDPFEFGLTGFANSASQRPAVSVSSDSWPLRDWFSDAGILICRPRPDQPNGLGAALKGGHNAEHHNHNDVGSFVVALAHDTPLLDPGAEVYTRRTFSSRRYESNVLNSFGHAVPRVAGKLQRPGREAAAKVLQASFSDAQDTLRLDLRSCYPVRELTKLVRTFEFSRQNRGSLTVTDEVQCQSPCSFETALVTLSPWKTLKDDTLVVGEGASAVRVVISAGPHRFRLEPVEIKEDLRIRRLPVRLGIVLAEPVSEAAVQVRIVPEQPNKPE